MTSADDISLVAARYRDKIERLTVGPDLPTKIELYLDPTERYAAFSFDTAGSNPPFRLTTDDLLALNFMDVPLRAMSYRRIVELRPEITSWLKKLSPDLHLWQMTGESQAYRDAHALWSILTGVAGIGPTRASALMARKRPKLIPILDRWVHRFYGERQQFWLPLGEALRDMELRVRVDRLRPPGLDTSALSLLRILDIAIWMATGREPPSVRPTDEEFVD